MMKDNELILYLYKKMVLIRLFEQKIEFGFSRNEIHGTTHLCIGQEAVPVGICANLADSDYVVSTHRGHGHALGKGLDVKRLMAEVMGKETGYCKGRGGTQHIACIEKGFLGTNGITGGGIPIATGAAFSIKYQEKKNVSVCFFGDGATNQGTFHESLNMASIWKLPIIYVCENNLYAMSTPINKSSKVTSLYEKASYYGIEGFKINGMDVIEVYNFSKKIIDDVRENQKPVFIECETYRFRGHSKSDPRVYRTRDEEAEWMEKCPIKRLRNEILRMDASNELSLKEIEDGVTNEIDEAYSFALESPVSSCDNILSEVYYDN